jgi:hypothetical protein
MTIPRVIEVPPRLEPVTPDTFANVVRSAATGAARPASS